MLPIHSEGAPSVLVDRKSTPWITAAILLFILAAALYIPYELNSHNGPTGGSWQGLAYGIAGTALMAFAMLLALRKRLRTWQLGRVYTWTQGHVWLALLSYPLIIFHAGFRWGQPGSLTWVMMWVFTIIVVSGIFGVVMQNIIPRMLLNDLQHETIYDEIDHVIHELADEAANIVSAATPTEESIEEENPSPGGTMVLTAPAAMMATARRQLTDFYSSQIKPYLSSPRGQHLLLTTAPRSAAAFDEIRRSLPQSMREPLNQLESIVTERRELERQRHLHHWLHTWLLIHVPLSYALTLLAIIHIVIALRYR
jgi:hypothetical protein